MLPDFVFPVNKKFSIPADKIQLQQNSTDLTAWMSSVQSAEVSVAPTNQSVDAEVTHAPDLVEDKKHGRLKTWVWRKTNRKCETNASAVGQLSSTVAVLLLF